MDDLDLDMLDASDIDSDFWESDKEDDDREVNKQNSRSKRQLVAGIDFGTTYSGFAYSFKHEWTKIIVNQYHGGEYLTHKAPTTLLLNPDKSFCKFGFDAEKEYAALAEDDKHRDYFFFRRFKLILKPELTNRVNRQTVCADENGKECEAMTIFTYCINYLVESLLESVNKKITGKLEMKDIDFIITVPAIWDDTAKMFMIEAAKNSLIQPDQMRIVLESEAASVYCQYMHFADEKVKEPVKMEKTGFKFMVIDLGGGTSDISVHERASNKSLKQVIMPTGISWGGTKVDDAYWQFFCDLLGERNMKRFKEECMEDYLDFFRRFEVQKRSGPSETSENIYIRIPMSLSEILNDEIPEAISLSKYKDAVSFDKKALKLKMNYKLFENFFTGTCKQIRTHLLKLWDENDLAKVKTALLVGGFSECHIIQKMIKELMKEKQVHLILPAEPALAVVKGAVYTGHVPKAVSTRISNYSYGIQNWPSFDPEKHPAEKKIIVDNTERCRDVFVKFFNRGDKITHERKKRFILEVLKPGEEKLECSVFMSHDDDPKFIDDDGVFKAGSLDIFLPKDDKPIDIEVTVTILDKGIRIEAIELGTFKEFIEEFDMLSVQI
uniref:Heat shock 70 kDa protein 12A-like n=1 Tax=Crassostrea virginica TaxID=6565 RepID=A0A8B8D3U7_CRAVI|nr:heat shock 70 kDa protein 12A-like [Crassostrea virginica]XP_022322386.1 heat shock 70 kDa protein 12A-like [Crassostrea virginica]